MAALLVNRCITNLLCIDNQEDGDLPQNAVIVNEKGAHLDMFLLPDPLRQNNRMRMGSPLWYDLSNMAKSVTGHYVSQNVHKCQKLSREETLTSV